MNSNKTHKLRWRWVLGVLVIGFIAMLFACDQPAGQSDLSKKAPPNLGAIADVDGADEGKKDDKKPQAGAEQTAGAKSGRRPAGPGRSKTVAHFRRFGAAAEGVASLPGPGRGIRFCTDASVSAGAPDLLSTKSISKSPRPPLLKGE